MDTAPISIRMMLYTAAFSLGILALVILKNNFDTRTTVVFCDVGQGDGTYMRIRNKIDVIIDAGPDNSMLRCLGKYMPFFDRTVELAFITHPQKDHYFGFLEIGNRYLIKNMFMNALDSDNKSFKNLLKILKTKSTIIFFPHEGTRIQALGTEFYFLWPSEKYVSGNISPHVNLFKYDRKTAPDNIEVSSYMGTSKLDPNFFSFIFTFKQESIRILFTGDSSEEVLNKLLKKEEIKTDILKVPHHGSKNGLNLTFLQLADPSLSVISAGRSNRYGHPSQEIIRMFEKLKMDYISTNKEGTIVFKLSESVVERVK